MGAPTLDNIPLIGGIASFLRRQKPQFRANILKNQASGFAVSLPTQYQALYLTALGASPLLLGYMNSITGIVMMAVAVPAGFILDRFGLKRVMLAALIFYTLGALALGLSGTWETATLALVIVALGNALDRLSCPMVCGSMLKSSERATGMGICDTFSMAPSLVAPFAAAALITMSGGLNAAGIRPIYYLQAAAFLIAIAIIYTRFKTPETPHTSTPLKNPLADAGKLLNRNTSLWVILTMLSTFPIQVYFYTSLFAAEVKGADAFTLGGMSVAYAAVMLLAIPIGRASDSFGRKKVIIISAALAAASYAVLITAQNTATLLIAGLLSGFTMTISQTQTAIAPDLIPPDYLGRWYGLLAFFRGVISIVAPLLCGYVWYMISPESVFILLILVQLTHLAVLMLIPTSITR